MEIVSIDLNEIDLFIATKLIESYLPDTTILSYSNSQDVTAFLKSENYPEVALINFDFLRLAGFDLLNLLRKKKPSTAIYITTSFLTPHEEELTSRYSVKGIIEKPLSENDILKLASHRPKSNEGLIAVYV